MKKLKLGHVRRHAGRWRSYAVVSVVCAVFPVGVALAQQVFVPPPVLPEAAPQPIVMADTNRPSAEVDVLPPPVTPRPYQPFQVGPLTLRPSLVYQFVYGTGILSGPGSDRNTIAQQISPGMRFELGSHWKLDYTPAITLYSDSNFKDTLNHYLDLSGATSYYDWTFKLGQNCALSTDPQVETATQTDQQVYRTTLGAEYQLNSEMSLEFEAAQQIQSVSGFTNSVGSSQNWSTLDWLNVRWGPNLRAGAGVGFGYEAVEIGSDMTYEQVQGRIQWHLVNKVNLFFNGGLEIRQFLDSSVSDAINPVLGLGLDYHPFDGTTILLSAERKVSSSYFQNQIAENTRLSANLSQRLLRYFYLGLSGALGVTDYSASTEGTVSGRSDDYGSFSVSLNTMFLKRGTAGVFYSISRNSSSDPGFSFSSQQYGFQLAYRY